MKVFIDGQFYSKESAKISVFDHGLLYGDGVFEGIRFYNGRVFQLDEHLCRLYDSARALCLNVPIDKPAMKEALLETIRQNELRDGYVRLIITRGEGNLGLDPNSCPQPTVIIIASKIALYPPQRYEEGLMMITCATRRISQNSLSPQVKSLNYLNNILAKIEAQHAGAGEGLMLNEQGYIAECTGDNIFVIKDGKLSTPPISAGALAGITRKVTLDIAMELKLPISEPNMTRYDVYTADECFLTGTAAEIIPVVKLDGRTIGDGNPGAITKMMINRFRLLTESIGEAIY